MALSGGLTSGRSHTVGQSSDSIDFLVRSIKEMVIHCMPYLREAGSFEGAEDSLLHMEENDEHFHRHSFVRKLRSQIDSNLGGLIEDEIEKHSLAVMDDVAGQETLVSKISSKVLASKQYQTMVTTLKSNVISASDILLKNFDNEFTAGGSDKSTLGHPHQKAEILYSDGESSLGDSSLNHSTVMFMNNEQFHYIADSLDKRRSVEVRRDGLKKLMSIATVDVQTCECWPRIKQGLQEALSESDAQLWVASLQILARGFTVNNACTKDIYLTIVEFLAMLFRKGSVPKLKSGLDFSKQDQVKIIKSFRLINEFQRQVPQFWVRYPEKFLDDVLEATCSLLSIHSSTTAGSLNQITPLHLLALVDIRAHWLTTWLHGNYSRMPLLKILHKNRSIVDNAVRSCLSYASQRRMDSISPMDPQPSRTPSSRGSQRIYYSAQELDYAYFVHSLYLIGKLVFFDRGRAFFPVKVKEGEEPISLTQLIVVLVRILIEPFGSAASKLSGAHCEPRHLVSDVIKTLCTSEVVCEKCLCHDAITLTILEPLTKFISSGGDAGLLQTLEPVLMQVADILSCIAATSVGRHHLLYGQSSSRGRFQAPKGSGAHVLAEFASLALSDKLNDITPESKMVVGNLVFVCRQLYSTCEGLLIMGPHDLHNKFAQAWKIAHRETELSHTPTPQADNGGGDSTPRESQYIALWEDTLRDDLLNFAATPKGFLLLQQTGAINECCSYLDFRHTQKLQVSKFEKFGYGYMLSQVCGAATGTVALHSTGFIRNLVKSVWASLEDDSPMYTPKIWAVTVMDKSAKKSFVRLATILASFLSVNEIFGGKLLPTKDSYTFRDIPDTLLDLFDRLVMVETPNKMHSLFNYEQTHAFGLRLLGVMTSCLDTFLLLQTQYNIQSMLLRCQADHMLPESKTITVDMLSVERNYLLVKTYLIGGPTERNVPSREVIESNEKVPRFALFSNYPVPSEYQIKVTNRPADRETDLTKFLSDTKSEESNITWLDRCRKSFCNLLTTKPDAARGTVLMDMLDRCIQVLINVSEEAVFPLVPAVSESASKSVKLNPVQSLGVELTVRYGVSSKIITLNSKEGKEKMSQLLRRSIQFLQQQQKVMTSKENISKLYSLSQPCAPGYDWFVATIFLMMNGSADKSWKFIHKFSTQLSSAYLWTHRLHASTHLPQSLMKSAIPMVFPISCHYIELILQSAVPHVFSAFKLSGFSPAQICQHWIRQVFWNYLDWIDICHYVCVCILLGSDYQIYMCVAVLRHLQRNIMRSSQNRDLITYLKEEPIRGFKVGENLEYMRSLETKYRSTVLKEMKNFKKL